MDETTLKDFAKRAREIAKGIQQRDRPPDPPLKKSFTWTDDMIKRPPGDLDRIAEQMIDVAKNIDAYLKR
jgi:hypothetical protein